MSSTIVVFIATGVLLVVFLVVTLGAWLAAVGVFIGSAWKELLALPILLSIMYYLTFYKIPLL